MTKRCGWVSSDPLYISYHDKEWGVPLKNETKLFEFLTLESAQAGLSWITILKKRENYRKAFAEFDPEKVSKFNSRKIQSLMKNAGIIRNELKIKAAINNAARFLEIQKEFGSFYKYSLQFVGGSPKINRVRSFKKLPALTKEAEAFSKDLKKRGFKFLGPTTLYAHMQASGMVNDHEIECFRYEKICQLMKKA